MPATIDIAKMKTWFDHGEAKLSCSVETNEPRNRSSLWLVVWCSYLGAVSSWLDEIVGISWKFLGPIYPHSTQGIILSRTMCEYVFISRTKGPSTLRLLFCLDPEMTGLFTRSAVDEWDDDRNHGPVAMSIWLYVAIIHSNMERWSNDEKFVRSFIHWEKQLPV